MAVGGGLGEVQPDGRIGIDGGGVGDDSGAAVGRDFDDEAHSGEAEVDSGEEVTQGLEVEIGGDDAEKVRGPGGSMGTARLTPGMSVDPPEPRKT